MAWLLVGEIRRVVQRNAPGPDGKTHQVQVLASETLSKSGEIKDSLFTFSTSDPAKYAPFVGQRVLLEVSPFAGAKGLGVARPDAGLLAPLCAVDSVLFEGLS